MYTYLHTLSLHDALPISAQERAIKAEDVVRAALAAHAKQAEPQAVAAKPLRWPPECPRGQRVYGRGITLKYCLEPYGGDSEDTVPRWDNGRAPRSQPSTTFQTATTAHPHAHQPTLPLPT